MKEKGPLLEEIDRMLQSTDWEKDITFDRPLAERKGVVVLRWKKTGVAVPLKIKITQEALETGELHLGELRRVLKRWLPENVIGQSVSDVNRLLRDGNRRRVHQVAKDIETWIEETAETLKKVFGREVSNRFLEPASLPPTIRPQTMAAFQFIVEAKISKLMDL